MCGQSPGSAQLASLYCPGVLPTVRPDSATSPPLTSGVAPSPVAELGVLTSPIPAETPGCRCTVPCGASSRDSELLSILVLRVVEDSGPGVEGKEKGSCGRHGTGQVWFKGQNQEPLPQTEVGRGPSPFLFFAYSNLFAFLVFCWFGLLLWPGFV